MTIEVVGLSHHNSPIVLRERLAFSNEQATSALACWQREYPGVEAVILSTCNRTEIYTATKNGHLLGTATLASFLGRFHGVEPAQIAGHLYEHTGLAAVSHLFAVAASLDSMVVGESQILAQVKQAYQRATQCGTAGPVSHAAFQAAVRAARRVAGETAIHHRRLSIPSVAVADFAQRIFERFDDKQTLVIGAGEMAEETLRYLAAEGARDVTVVNRDAQRAADLAARWHGNALDWSKLPQALARADLVISTTGSEEPIVTEAMFRAVEGQRQRWPLFVLDLAVPRDFDPAIGDRAEVYLYSIDDLSEACQRNRRHRDRELPAALKIVEEEADRFVGELHHRMTGPVIQQLREGWQKPKEEELRRLFNKLPDLDSHEQDEIRQSFDRLINKLLHPPLESLRQESRQGFPNGLLDALARLFQLKD